MAIPLTAIRRYPIYIRWIAEQMSQGAEYVSAMELAWQTKLDPGIVRKELSLTGVSGLPRKGFPAEALYNRLQEILGRKKPKEAVVCGVGNLGKALLGYEGFSELGMKIVAGFDVDENLIGRVINGVPILDIKKLRNYVEKAEIKAAYLSVPASCAAEIGGELVKAGIVCILNFTPIRLKVSSSVFVEDVSLRSSISVLRYLVDHSEEIEKANYRTGEPLYRTRNSGSKERREESRK